MHLLAYHLSKLHEVVLEREIELLTYYNSWDSLEDMSEGIFNIHNLPYGIISHPSRTKGFPLPAVAYKDFAIDLTQLIATDLAHLSDQTQWATIKAALNAQTTWNAFAGLPSDHRKAFRRQLQFVLTSHTNSTGFNPAKHPAYLPLAEITMHLPFDVHNFSDFYCSYEHAKNCSAVFNIPFSASSGSSWFTIPQVYNGRTSSLAVSGTPVTRPYGVFPSNPGEQPQFQPENKLDFELEMGIWVSKPVKRGER